MCYQWWMYNVCRIFFSSGGSNLSRHASKMQNENKYWGWGGGGGEHKPLQAHTNLYNMVVICQGGMCPSPSPIPHPPMVKSIYCCYYVSLLVWGESNRAVYTGINKPEFFSHSGFSLEVARQLPINTAKNTNRKTHLRSVVFWNSAGFSLVFCQCKRSLPSHRYYSGFGHVGRDLRNHPRPATYCALHTVKGREKSRMRTT